MVGFGMSDEYTVVDCTDWDIFGDADTPKILMSIVREMDESLTARDIVGVQPMTAPTGHVYTWKAIYNPPEKAHNRNGANS